MNIEEFIAAHLSTYIAVTFAEIYRFSFADFTRFLFYFYFYNNNYNVLYNLVDTTNNTNLRNSALLVLANFRLKYLVDLFKGSSLGLWHDYERKYCHGHTKSAEYLLICK